MLKITIVPRSRGSLGFAQYLPNESTLMNKRQLIDQICVILGGRAAEEHFFKEVLPILYRSQVAQPMICRKLGISPDQWWSDTE